MTIGGMQRKVEMMGAPPADRGEYDRAFYDALWEGGRTAARTVLPPVIEGAGVRTLVDVGCGGGGWLSVAAELGVRDLTGLDSAGSRGARQRFDDFEFVETDLSRPFSLARRVDLAVSIEVAEHLPEHRARSFVDDLCALAPLVLFSAAYPGQGGTGHVNERWPSYWCEHFEANAFTPLEVCRPAAWNDVHATTVVKMNVLLYAEPDALRQVGDTWPRPTLLDVVHPQLWDEVLAAQGSLAHRVAGKVEATARTIGQRIRDRRGSAR